MQDEPRRAAPRRTGTRRSASCEKNIDTGMGIERVAYLLQGVDNVYETDLVRPVIARAEECPAAATARPRPTTSGSG
jgi:alanyl-tRNA synthetase